MRCVVYGGRDWNNQTEMNRFMNKVMLDRPITFLINGGQVTFHRDQRTQVLHRWGADYQALLWATIRKIPHQVWPAQWSVYGLGAGPIRNNQMLVEGKPDFGVEFPGGKGTENMHEQLEWAKIPIIYYQPAPVWPRIGKRK